MTDELVADPDHVRIVAHYNSVVPLLVANFDRAPISWVTFPHGFGDRGVFHKDAAGVPDSIPTAAFATSTGDHRYVTLDARSLTWLVRGKFAVEFLSWTPRVDDSDKPAFGHVTLAPSGTASEAGLHAAADRMRTHFRNRGIEPICVLDGFRGITLWFAAAPGWSYLELAASAHRVVDDALASAPDLFTTAALRADRGDKIYLGTKNNHPGMGVGLPYAVRGTPGLEVVWPIAWERLGEIRNGDVRAENFADYYARDGDVFAKLARAASTAPATIALATVGSEFDALLASLSEAPGPQSHDFILEAALAVLADGKAYSAEAIREAAVARGLLPESTTPKYVYTALHEYVMRTLGAGRKPPFVQVEHTATFRLNRPVDVWPDIALPPLPRWLDDPAIDALVRRLTTTSVGGDPAAFEIAVCDAFAALGFATRHVGGEGEPDGIIDAPLAELGWRGILECKTASPGAIVANPRPEEPAKFREAFGAARAALVGPAFSSDASFLDELRVHTVSLWTTDDLATALREQIGPDELTPCFAPGPAADALADVLWERGHGERKRVAVTARTIVDRGWQAQLRVSAANAPGASPHLTLDALLVLVDEALGAVDPTLVVTRETVMAAIDQLVVSGQARVLDEGPLRRVIIRAPLDFESSR